MRLYFSALAVSIVVALAGAAAAAPLELYARGPTLNNVVISPDASKLALLRSDGNTRSIVIQDLEQNGPIAGVNLGEVELRGVTWAGSGHLVIRTSQKATPTGRDVKFTGPIEVQQLRLYDVKTRSFREVLAREPGASNFVLAGPLVRLVDVAPVLYVQAMRIVGSEVRESLFRIDVASGASRAVEDGPDLRKTQTDWTVDGAGRAIARTEYTAKTGAWKLSIKIDETWRLVQSGIYPIDPPSVVGLAHDPRNLVVARSEDGTRRYRLLSLADGAWGEGLDVDEEARLLLDARDGRVIGYIQGGAGEAHFFDPENQADWKSAMRAFAGESVLLESWSSDRKHFVTHVEGPKTGNAFALVDLTTRSASIIDDTYAGLTATGIYPAKFVDYTASDGMALRGVLVRPSAAAGRNAPLVVLPHSLSDWYDDLSFHWMAQAFSSRGYTVWLPDFRGSQGRGESFEAAGYGEWGRKMQSDISDGVRFLTQEGIADPNRVCIVGVDYGGYAALAGVTLEQDIYRCAVSVGGMSDLELLVQDKTPANAVRQRNRRKHLGLGNLDAYSPAKLADRAKAPILLIHAKDDTVVAFEQSRLMADALEKAGKKAELITLAGEDHWLSSGDTRLKMLTETVRFLEAHNPPN